MEIFEINTFLTSKEMFAIMRLKDTPKGEENLYQVYFRQKPNVQNLQKIAKIQYHRNENTNQQWINELNRKLKTIKETQLAKDYFKKSSITIVIRENKIQTTLKKITSAQSEWLLTGYNKCWKG